MSGKSKGQWKRGEGMSAHHIEGLKVCKRAGRLVLLVALSVLMLALITPSMADAEPDWPFTPELSISASTNQAGAHPDLKIEMHKPYNYCAEWSSGFGRRCTDPRFQQNLKSIDMHFPPGYLADANAAPYCDPYSVPGTGDSTLWFCRNESARVGTVLITGQACDVELSIMQTFCLSNNLIEYDPPLPDGALTRDPGVVYNARPRTSGPHKGEQGHLIVIWPKPHDGIRGYLGGASFVKTDVSVTIRESDIGMDAVTDDFPDIMPIAVGQDPGQAVDLVFTLEGSTGLDSGHPLLTNPSFCDPKSIDVGFRGYAFNSYYPGGFVTAIPGHGDGKLVRDSGTLQSTGCDAIPYSPTFTASSDTNAPGKPVALTAVVTQKDDEATTKKVDVVFPKGMGLNLGSTLKPCAAEKPDRGNCPDSLMGTVEAESRLLPVNPPNNGPLKGDVFLTGLKGDKLSLVVLLSGFINLRLDATAGVDSSGRLTASFNDLPSVPLSKLTLNLAGGNKSLITNPKRCGAIETTATFTSHSGKTHVASSPVAIKGCSNPTFDVELSEPAKGKRTGIELEVSSDQKPIKEVKFGIDRHMKLSTKGLGKKRKFGEISVTSDAGMKESALKRPEPLIYEKKKAFSLKVSALEGLGVNIYRKRFKRKGSKTFKAKRNRKNKSMKTRTVLKNRVSVKPLPKDNPTKVSVSINPDETKLLRNAKNKCRVNFIALIKTTDGVKYALKQTVKLRGKGCGKKKVTKKK